jgi:hypothetical protein
MLRSSIEQCAYLQHCSVQDGAPPKDQDAVLLLKGSEQNSKCIVVRVLNGVTKGSLRGEKA